MKSPIRNLGQVLSAIALDEARKSELYDDLHAFGAPSECYPTTIQTAREFRFTRRKAEALAQRPWRTIMRQADRRGLSLSSPRFERLVCRIADARARARYGNF